jgi:hypothetical protein
LIMAVSSWQGSSLSWERVVLDWPAISLRLFSSFPPHEVPCCSDGHSDLVEVPGCHKSDYVNNSKNFLRT